MAGKKKIDGANSSDNWGGVRPNSGRPTNGELINIRQILDEAIDPKMVTEMLKQRIESGDQRAIELYLKYRAGVPKQEIDLNTKSDVDLNVTLKGLVGFSDE
jgi:hypothetical protein|tara:strand:+ start:69 stop:374 length:306 start_codon:yes stop_codon:yes gene_type:complete